MITTNVNSAITQIWTNSAQRRIDFLPPGMPLWHCGHISSFGDVDANKALWTTRSFEKRLTYENSARENAKFAGGHATFLSLELKRPLKVGNFNKASLLDFTVKHCNAQHDTMKQALRQWCLFEGLDGVVSLNHDEDEVVVAHPAADLVFLSFAPLPKIAQITRGYTL
jgi:hypothetical protein